ncbi:MAG: threonylcarbamoyl-AMP synthase [Nitrospirales bacterium]|nr:threonylcarbamoyl-AMP synthase [Nitrospirales bacterium]
MAHILPFSEEPSSAVLDEARQCLVQGGVLAIPTESFYGLAASVTQPEAVSRVATTKQRSLSKPLLVLIGDVSQLHGLVATVPSAAEILIEHFWPGPLTMIFPAASQLAVALTGGTSTIAIRQPGHPALLALLRIVGPVTGTSANRSGFPPPRTASAVQDVLGDSLDLILDHGPTRGGKPSTLFRVDDSLQVVREGPITRTDIHAVLASAGFTVSGDEASPSSSL